MTISYLRRGALASRAISAHPGVVVLDFLRGTATSTAPVFVCTSGVWSVEVSFAVCDSYHIEIDGPAADDVRVSSTLEFEES